MQNSEICSGINGYDGTAAENAALGWRHVSLCHIASTLDSLEVAVKSSLRQGKGKGSMSTLTEAVADSFQGSSLGPVTYLGKMGYLPYISHQEFQKAINSGNVADLKRLLKRMGLSPGQPPCDELAAKLAQTCPSMALRTSLTVKYWPQITSNVLPYSHFPPGRSYFQNG